MVLAPRARFFYFVLFILFFIPTCASLVSVAFVPCPLCWARAVSNARNFVSYIPNPSICIPWFHYCYPSHKPNESRSSFVDVSLLTHWPIFIFLCEPFFTTPSMRKIYSGKIASGYQRGLCFLVTGNFFFSLHSRRSLLYPMHVLIEE